MKKVICFYILLISNLIFSQEKKGATSSFVISDDVSIIDQPKFYRSYFTEYNLKDNLFFRMEMLEQSNNNLLNSATLIEFPLLAKYKISNTFSSFLGPSVNVLKINGDIGDVSVLSTAGFEYKITEDLTVDGRVNLNVKSNATNLNYGTTDFVVYKVGAKLKF